MRKWLILVTVVLASLIGCMDNPYDPANIPNDLGITFALSRVNDSVNVYCFFPMDIKVALRDKENMRHIDSMYLFPSSNPDVPVYKLDSTLTQVFDYVSVGAHRAFLRVYERKLSGDYRDTVFSVRVAANYRANPINVAIGSAGSDVLLRGLGFKHESVDWEWDLSRLGLGIITAVGDTSVFVDKAVDDTVFLSQTRGGLRSPVVPVLFTTTK